MLITIYELEEEKYTNENGTFTYWQTKTKCDTVEEILQIAEKIRPGFDGDGNWKIIKKVIDEDTFKMNKIIIKEYNHYKETKHFDYIERQINNREKELKRLKQNLKRTTKEEKIEQIKFAIHNVNVKLNDLYKKLKLKIAIEERRA